MPPIVLESPSLRLTFDPTNGALIGLASPRQNWHIVDRPNLGLSFQMLLPLPSRRNNPVYGVNQRVNSVERADDGMGITLKWQKLTSQYGGEHDLGVTLDVRLIDQRAVYTMHIENRSEFVVENVICPYIGDMQRPPAAEWLKTFSFNYATAIEWNIWPTFDNLRGYYGVDHPTQLSGWSGSVGAPMAPFILLRSATQGLYIGVEGTSADVVAWHLELRPGFENSINSQVPISPKVAGHEVVTRFAAVHVPFIQPGETRTLTPIAIQAYEGGWQSGVDIYKSWRDGWLQRPRVLAWVQEPHAWQQLHLNSPEDELRLRFSDLPSVGEACVKHGVKALQLVGWNDGGQDQNNPSHDPDPRLGTFEELRGAIAQIKAMGVKVILFAKFTWADRATARFRDDLIRLAMKDPYGDYYPYSGYQYQTMTQLLDINTKRLVPMCFGSEEYLRICDDEFRKMVSLGADGILFDESMHHSPALLCFDTQHGHRYGASAYANDRALIKNFHAISDASDPDFLFAGEACYDWEMDAYHLSYHRSESKRHIPLSRYLMPEAPFMTAVTGFNDRDMINQCLMYRYIISYEPFNFKGQLDDFPLTLAYGKQMDALRTALRRYIWDAEFRDKIGASVTVDGKHHDTYSVFRQHDSGESALVIVNYEAEAIVAEIKVDDGQKLTAYRLVDDAEWQVMSHGVKVPAHSAAVVIRRQ